VACACRPAVGSPTRRDPVTRRRHRVEGTGRLGPDDAPHGTHAPGPPRDDSALGGRLYRRGGTAGLRGVSRDGGRRCGHPSGPRRGRHARSWGRRAVGGRAAGGRLGYRAGTAPLARRPVLQPRVLSLRAGAAPTPSDLSRPGRPRLGRSRGPGGGRDVGEPREQPRPRLRVGGVLGYPRNPLRGGYRPHRRRVGPRRGPSPEPRRGRRLDVAVVAFTDRSPSYGAGPNSGGAAFVRTDLWNPRTRRLVDAALARAREADPDLVFASPHWGPNWETRPSGTRRRFARWLVDRGVDLVHGHSAHVIRGVEVYRGRPILYDCGDSSTTTRSGRTCTTTGASRSNSRSRTGNCPDSGSSPSRSFASRSTWRAGTWRGGSVPGCGNSRPGSGGRSDGRGTDCGSPSTAVRGEVGPRSGGTGAALAGRAAVGRALSRARSRVQPSEMSR